jgi:four helix bundle protein
MHNFKELNVWLEAKNFSISIYQMTKLFPKSEVYGLTSQMNRSAVSIPSNIAEGAGRNSVKDFSRFINIAIGSSFELETQLIIVYELKMINENLFNDLSKKLDKTQRMLVNFNKYLKGKN